MDIMEVTTMLGTLLGVLAPLGGVGAWVYRKQNKRLKEAEAKLAEVNVEKGRNEAKEQESNRLLAQIDHQQGTIDKYIERYDAQVAKCAAMEDRHQGDLKDWAERYSEQTHIVRDQRREISEMHEREKEHIRKENLLMRRIQYLISFVCKRTDCDHGIPPRQHLVGCKFDDSQIEESEQEKVATINLTKTD